MSTKRTPKAALVAKSATSESVSAAPAAESAPDTRALAPMQTLLCDEAADLIIHGGHPDEVDHLLRAVIGNYSRRFLNLIWPDEQKTLEVSKLVEGRIGRLANELSIEWRRNCRATSEERVAPKTATDRIRAGVIEEMREYFEYFGAEGSPEEHRIMREMLIWHHSGATDRELFGELPLATLMHEQVQGITRNFVRVPERFRKQVDAYSRESLMACLYAIEHYRGCSTPAEEFINSILILYKNKIFTPDDVKRDFEEFCSNYASAEGDVSLFIKNNPRKFKELSFDHGFPHTPEAA